MSNATDIAKKFLHGALSLAGSAAIAAAVTAFPLLGAPVISQFFSWTVKWVIAKIEPHLEVLMVDLIIDAERRGRNEAFIEAREELRKVLDSHVTNPEELQNASQDFDRRFDALIRIRP